MDHNNTIHNSVIQIKHMILTSFKKVLCLPFNMPYVFSVTNLAQHNFVNLLLSRVISIFNIINQKSVEKVLKGIFSSYVRYITQLAIKFPWTIDLHKWHDASCQKHLQWHKIFLYNPANPKLGIVFFSRKGLRFDKP